ncbi:MAG: S-methyl-5'-thioadenosine phosphorylase [Candidatus Omnitrophica bacterium]|nr:S-methyl-5'-thioadenosine phosphorylase [Candidatus Omnitrophota bacterium]
MIGVIGGSAVYEIEGLEVFERKTVRTPFGDPSDEIVIGKLAGKDVAFLPRHQRDHSLLPTELNFRANIYAFKLLGVDRIISISAVGSLKEEIEPLDIVLVDQFIDRTNQGRSTTFFGDGLVAHIAFADPTCSELSGIISKSNKDLDIRIHEGGTYVNMEGPAFSTRAESSLYRSWGADIIGMTNLQEARLAREAEICYATIAMVTDYDCWRVGEGDESVSMEMIIENLNRNARAAGKMLVNAIERMPENRSCECADALKDAIITRKEAVPADTLEKLKPIVGKYME